jgi:hypothetical protein
MNKKKIKKIVNKIPYLIIVLLIISNIYFINYLPAVCKKVVFTSVFLQITRKRVSNLTSVIS